MPAVPGAPVAAQRALVGVDVTLSVQLRDQYGEAVAPVGTVTVDVARADGTVLVTAGATSGSSTAPRTYTLVAASNTKLDLLTVTWKDGGTARLTTLVEIVGGFFFSVTEVEAFDTSLGDIHTASADLAKARRVREEVERECERITRCAWVPRYRRLRISGSGTRELVLPDRMWSPRVLRSVGVYSGTTVSSTYSASDLAAVDLDESGILTRGSGTWAWGDQNVLLEVEYGYDRPPEDLRHAAMSRFRSRWNMETAPAGSENAVRFTTPGGLSIDQSDADQPIGQVEVFRVYKQHQRSLPGVA